MSDNIRIRRARKDAQNPYKALPRALFEDNRLSFEARGVMGYILMKPDDWEVRVTDLRKAGNIGRDKTYNIINELIAAGYMERISTMQNDGTFGNTYYLVHEEPLTEKPDTARPDTARPYPVDQEHTKEEKKLSKKVTNKERELKSEADASPPSEQQEWFGVVCAIVHWDYRVLTKEQKAQVAQTITTLKNAGYTLEEAKSFIEKVWVKDWRYVKNNSWPTLSQLRTEIGKVKASPLIAEKEKQNVYAQYG